MITRPRLRIVSAYLRFLVGPVLLAMAAAGAQGAVTSLADQPIFTQASVPGNVALTLSVEFPTATSIANGIVNYSSATTYYGNFDPTKCYYYNQNTTKTGPTAAPYNGSYFQPNALANADHSCANASTAYLWSGNFLNWAAMSTIDPFRWALTGGYRSVDNQNLTILEKAWAPPAQGSANESPPQVTDQTAYANLTPFPSSSWGNIWTNVYQMGQYMCFTANTAAVNIVNGTLGSATYTISSTNFSGTLSGATEYSSGMAVNHANVYCVEVRVQVCNTAAPMGVESNCTLYPSGYYKPEGLIQQYSQQLRFADFGYLLDSAANGNIGVRDGGVMRARMEYVGPTQPVPNGSPITNPNAEWDPMTGVFIANPDTADVTSTLGLPGCANCNIPNSGVVNYLNMFGEHARSLGNTKGYKSYDNVSEMYYTALRYYKELGNVPEYTALTSYNADLALSDCVTYGADQCVDGFPVITNWYPADSSAPRGYDFPIQYYCQKNFIIGIGDENTHQDENLPGTYGTGGAALSQQGSGAAYEPNLESLVASGGGINVGLTPPCKGGGGTPVPCSDTTVDTTNVTNWIGTQEALFNGPVTNNYDGQSINGRNVNATGPLGQTPWDNYGGCCGGATFYIAGLAYDAHVNDMLPGVFTNPNGNKPGIQTVSTYWVDVLEYGHYRPQSPFWMAAKYGGFAVPTGYTEFSTPTVSGVNWPTSIWASQGNVVYQGATPYLVPDNYYSGRDSGAMVSGLNNAFASIAAASKTLGSTSLALSTPYVIATNNANYSAYYDPNNWTGNVQAQYLSFDAQGNPVPGAVAWGAQANLQAQVPPGTDRTNRRVVTWNHTVGEASGLPWPANGFAVPFLPVNLSATETTDLTPSTSAATINQIVDYLRGDQSNEGTNGAALFRARAFLLGDIVDSQAVPIGPPSGPITTQYNAGYDSFQNQYASRDTVVYVGGNDGMLHAFDGSLTDATAGQELWAYVPGALYAGPTGTPYTNGLVSRSYKNFVHYNFVDATPVITDVDFDNAGGSFSTTAQDWHTILVGGLGKGGMSYYAIDVTNPAAMTSETAVAGKVLWEFNQNTITNCPITTCNGSTATIGYSFGPATITKTAKYGWVVILTSGYDNSDGIGYFFMVNPKTGALLEPPISTATGTASSPSGLTYASGFVPNYQDGTSDSIYAGDLFGNIWRVDLTPTSGNYAPPVQLAIAQDPSGNPQPITTRPLIEVDPIVSLRYVLVGTGKTLSTSDLSNTQINTIYSILDGTAASGGFFTPTSPALPAGTTYPITRSELTSVSSLLVGTCGSTPGTDCSPPPTGMGWYTDLAGASSTGSSQQVDVQPTANDGVAAFGINTSTGGSCDPGAGNGTVVAFDIGTGVTHMTDMPNGNATASFAVSGRVTNLEFVNVGGTAVRLTAGSNAVGGNPLVNVSGNYQSSGGVTKLNWRQIKGGN